MSHIGSPRRASTVRLLIGVAASLLGFAWAIPAANAATGVSNVTVSNASPSTAANALTTYAIGFKTSGTGALVGNSGANITITLPSATDLAHLHGSPLYVGATQEGFCQVNSFTPPVAACYIYGGSTVAANTTVAITLNGVTNPSATGSYTLQVATTADTTTRTSPSYSVTAVGAVSKPSIAIASPSSAANARTTYAIGFTTSAKGGLSGDAGSSIIMSLPNGTVLDHLIGSSLDYNASQIGFCQVDTFTPPVAACYIYTGSSVPASAALSITLNGVTNPGSAATLQLNVTTTSDTKSVKSANYSVTPVSSISALTVHNTPPSASAGALTTYAIGLTTSATGGLAGNAGSGVSITFPSGTVLATLRNSPLLDGVDQVGFCQVDTFTPPVAACYVYTGTAVPAGHALTLQLNGVNNPKTSGNKKLTVSTTSDTPVVTSPNYNVAAQTAVGGASIALSKTTTSATGDYTVKFTAATALAGDSGSAINIDLGAGTNVNALSNSPVMVGATQVGFCQKGTTTSVVCYIYTGTVVNAGDHVVASIVNVKNPAATKQYSMKLSTTSDTKVKSVPYCVAAVGVPCITKFSPASGTVGTAVTITGINLGAATSVKFNGTAAVIGTNTATKITTTVPAGATTGTITVTNSGGTATSTKQFTVLP